MPSDRRRASPAHGVVLRLPGRIPKPEQGSVRRERSFLTSPANTVSQWTATF